MHFLVVVGTVRNQRKSIYPARKITEEIRNRNHDVVLFDMKNKDIPLLKTRRYTGPDEPPRDVERFGELVEMTDCLVIVCPEYNHSYPGALKNLLDYLYPEYNDLLFAYITVSAGGFGGVRVGEDLVSLTVTLGGIPGPSLPVSNVGSVFNENGDLVDESYEGRFNSFVEKIEEVSEDMVNI